MDFRNFRYLDDLIHSGEKEIFLTSDVVLNEDEDSEYSKGINLDVDSLIIDGGGHAVDGRGKARIFYSTANVIIKNIVLKNGCGAIYNSKAALKISQSKLLDNASEVAGAAIYNNWGEVEIHEVELSGNVSGCHGGAIFSVNGVVNISNSKLSGNTAKTDGGAIYNGSKLNIRNSILSKNAAGGSGGAIYDNRGQISICESVLSENSSDGTHGGGAIHKNRGELNIRECELSSNSAAYDGGAIFSIDCEMNISKSELFANESKGNGGAIYDWGELKIAESEISNNVSNDGGGLYTKNNDDVCLKDCRFENNAPNDMAPKS